LIFPRTSTFEELGKSLGLKEDEVISRIKRLQNEGAIRRIGPIISTKKTGGMSTLVAMKVPPERVDEVAGLSMNMRKYLITILGLRISTSGSHFLPRAVRGLMRY